MSVVICITAGCGGQGCSALTTSLAKALSSEGHTVAAVDANSGAGALNSMLGTEETAVFNIGDVLTGRCELSDAAVRPFAGAVLFPAAKSAEDAPLSELYPLLARLERYDYILIDMPAAESEGANRLLSGANMVVLCSRSTLRELECTYRTRRRLQRLGSNVRLVLNAVNTDDLEFSNLDCCIDTAKTRLLGVVPSDREFATTIAKGVPPKSGEAYEAVVRIAQRLRGQKVEIPKM